MTAVCPECLAPIQAKPQAKDGRCFGCRRTRRREHSTPKRNRTDWQQFLLEHERGRS